MGVVVNGVAKGDILALLGDGDVLVRTSDWLSLGFLSIAGETRKIGGREYLSLKTVPGLRFEFVQARVTLNLEADPQLFPETVLDLGPVSGRGVVYPRDNSFFLNYGVLGTREDGRSSLDYQAAGEVGVRFNDLLFFTNGLATKFRGDKNEVRLLSNVTYDRREELQRFIVGDFFGSSGDFGSSVPMAGLSVSKSFRLNPYLVRGPLPEVVGEVAVPSEVEVFVDGRRIRTLRVSPGEYRLENVFSGLLGVRDVKVVVRDIYGRERIQSFPFYFSSNALGPGLEEYSYNFGVLREDYGLRSNEYAGAAALAFHRLGINRFLTLGYTAELSDPVKNGGPNATLTGPRLGELSASLRLSDGDESGGIAGTILYNLTRPRWAVAGFYRGFNRSYRAIGAPVEPGIRYQTGATLSLTQPGWGTASVGYQTTAPFEGEKRDTYTVGISPFFPDGRTSLLLTAAHSTGAFSDTVVSLSIYHTFGPGRDYRASAQTTQRDEGHVETLTLEKVRPIGEGLGFILRGESARFGAFDSTVFEPSFIYNAPAASFGARRFQSGGDGGPSFTEVTLSGSIVGVGGEVNLGRAVSDSFAIARVGDVPGARVYYNAQDMGRTDDRGQVVISELNSFLENQVSFQADDVPLNYTFRQNQIVISPPFRSGTLVDFGLQKIRPAIGYIELESGGKRAPAASVLVQLAGEGRGYEIATAGDGGFYIDDLAPGVYRLSFEFQGSHCETQVSVQETSAELLDLGRISCAP